jgi:hypothetical protein
MAFIGPRITGFNVSEVTHMLKCRLLFGIFLFRVFVVSAVYATLTGIYCSSRTSTLSVGRQIKQTQNYGSVCLPVPVLICSTSNFSNES